MKIVNKTHWRTDQMRAVLQRCAEMELEAPHRTRMVVEVTYRRRGGGSSGCAFVKSNWCRVRVSSDAFDVVDFAFVACHEFAHCRGMEHRQMPRYYVRNVYGGTATGHERYAWAAAHVVERKAPPARPTAVDLASARHRHALAMQAKAETRAKRATTLLRKWNQKVAYYERRMAALKPSAVPDV